MASGLCCDAPAGVWWPGVPYDSSGFPYDIFHISHDATNLCFTISRRAHDRVQGYYIILLVNVVQICVRGNGVGEAKPTIGHTSFALTEFSGYISALVEQWHSVLSRSSSRKVQIVALASTLNGEIQKMVHNVENVSVRSIVMLLFLFGSVTWLPSCCIAQESQDQESDPYLEKMFKTFETVGKDPLMHLLLL